MSKWKESSLEDITETIFSGGTPSTTNDKFWNGIYPWLSSGETRHRFITTTEKRITQHGIDGSGTKLAAKGDIVIASAGQGHTRGQTSFLNIDTYINQSIVAIRADRTKIEPLWLFYNLSMRYKELRQLSDSHSSRGSLTGGLLKKLKISYPPVQEQQKIATMIYAFDQKIELNSQINQTLEQIAQAMFKSWFIDFDPVHAKIAALAQGDDPDIAAMTALSGKSEAELQTLKSTNPERYQQLQQLAAAFPNELVEIDGVEVPRGWKVKKLDNLIKFIKGKKPKNLSTIKEKGMFPHVLVSGLTGKYTEFSYPDNLVISSFTDTLVLMDGSGSGRVSIGHTGIVGSTLSKLHLSNNIYWALLYSLLKNKEEDIKKHTTGTSIPHADKKIILNYDMYIPCDFILFIFNDFLKNTLDFMQDHRLSNSLLEKLKDELCNKLLAGDKNE